MTFCLGFASAQGALVAADTRVLGDSHPAEDRAELRFTNPLGGQPIVFPVTQRKIRPLRGGWMTSAGLAQFTRLVFQAVAQLDAREVGVIGETIARTRAILEPALATRYPEQAEQLRDGLPRTGFILVHQGVLGCECTVFDANGRATEEEHVAASFPKDFPLADAPGVLAGYERLLPHAESLGGVLRQTGGLFQRVARQTGPTGTISNIVEIGVLDVVQGVAVLQHLPPTACDVVLKSSDSALRERLVRLP